MKNDLRNCEKARGGILCILLFLYSFSFLTAFISDGYITH